MITKIEAIASVREVLPAGVTVDERYITEKPYGWLIHPQSEEFLRTGNELSKIIGHGGFIVEKVSGRHITLGSAYTTETNLKIYELGYFNYDSWDLVVTKVSSLTDTLDILDKLKIQYIQIEHEGGTDWRIPKRYKRKRLKRLLEKLPCRFKIGGVYFLWEELEALKKQNHFQYALEENTGYENKI